MIHLLIIKPKKVKLEKEENVNFTVKTIPGEGHCIVNCFSMFFGKDSSEILSLLWNKFQENTHLYMGFSEYKSTEELLKSLEDYILNKRYNHDTVDLVFEALSKIFDKFSMWHSWREVQSMCKCLEKRRSLQLNLRKRKRLWKS